MTGTNDSNDFAKALDNALAVLGQQLNDRLDQIQKTLEEIQSSKPDKD